MKKGFKYAIVSMALCVAGIVSMLCACQKESPLKSFKLGEVYGQFNGEPLYIEVTMADEYTGSFTIDDKATVDEIYSVVANQVWYLTEEPVPPGSNKDVKFVFGGNSYVLIGTANLIYRGEMYVTGSAGLDIRLNEIGLEKGAISRK